MTVNVSFTNIKEELRNKSTYELIDPYDFLGIVKRIFYNNKKIMTIHFQYI